MSRPLLVVYCGLPGVGKSTVSAYTAEQLGATRYRSDEVRKDLFEEPSYTSAETRATYDELLERARAELEAGRDVVVDATFRERRERDRAETVAVEADATAQFVHVTCPSEIVVDRLHDRTDDPSDADLEVYREHRDSFDPFERDHVTIDNGGSLAETRRQVDRCVLEPLGE